MKLKFSPILLALVCCLSHANDSTPIKGVSNTSTDSPSLSIQNLSNTTVAIDIYGDVFQLSPNSGLSFDCQGYSFVEIQLKDLIHDFFEVSCPSQVQISENFTLTNE